ncbi:LacI family DNA-binding transcriptional regulator [Ovoidimarina sediminis]|uniref:LacI family DNA-binding transcriptional regulator n=1 Tax=Ovoidimarina sediminis TaxID=3079856 RepID=UPI00292CAB31|nr:substrate-binding domain-containing protein [Rhodophyticola sp. MJ-SS7]
MRARVTISQVADALGLTKGTVSRALNGYPDISPSTRVRVQAQAQRMGYRPLAQAQAIRTGRSRAIGLVLQTDVPGAQRPFLSDFLAGITRALSAESWTLTLSTSPGGAEMLTTLERLVDERKADGFILPRTFAQDARMRLLREMDVPFVLYGRVEDPDGCAWFDILGEDAMRAAVARLAGHGHTRIGFVNGGTEYNFSRLREGGFLAGLDSHGFPQDPTLIRRNAMTRQAGAAAVESLLAEPGPPTAIVFAVDAAALGAYDAAQRLGLRIGRDLSIISYDGIPEGGFVDPPLTTFHVDSRMAGARLAELLIRRIGGAAPETLRETAEADLRVGGSDGPPAHRSEALARMLSAPPTTD